MFVGKLMANPYQGIPNLAAKQTKAPSAPAPSAPAHYDRVEIGAGPRSIQAMENTSYTWAAPDSRLQKELLPPSEQPSYTQEDALMNQYMKQFRIEGYFDGETFVNTSSEPVRLVVKDGASQEELEAFRQELAEKGLGDEIDWQGVRSDFVQMGANFGNIERFSQKVDYLASRYAVLKDRIQQQYTGSQQEAELQTLEQIYAKTKNELADSYAKNIGGLYESLGQAGAAEDMRSSVLALVDQKADAYTAHIEQNGLDAGITGPDQEWLKQDDGYMAAQLRQSASALLAEQNTQSESGQAVYDGNDLAFAGVFAKKLAKQLEDPAWNVNQSDEALGRELASQYKALKADAGKAGVSEKLTNMLTGAFPPFMDRLMDSLDASIEGNRQWAAEKPWISGMIRTSAIDRQSVYQEFYGAL